MNEREELAVRYLILAFQLLIIGLILTGMRLFNVEGSDGFGIAGAACALTGYWFLWRSHRVDVK